MRLAIHDWRGSMNIRRQSIVARSVTVATAAAALYVFTAQPSAQTARTTDHWVATWATAAVSRVPVPPQRGAGPGAPAAAPAQGAAPQGQAPAAAPQGAAPAAGAPAAGAPGGGNAQAA